ncbi:MAG TPA: hypothetical protein ENN81_08125, partial [Phycisphaerales bacterium]|nr:hypothetical protein [Phycisphaerales bacterium]
MAQHLTEKELIEYQFKLAKDADYRRMQAHLQQCEPCSAALRGVAERFSALELLRGQATASDELIGRTLDGLKTPDASQIAHFNWQRWVLAAAAVVMVGAGLLIMNYTGDGPARHGEYAKKLDSLAEPLGVGDEMSAEEVVADLTRRVAGEPLADKGTADAPAAPELVVAAKPRESLMDDMATLPGAAMSRAVGRREAALDVNQMLVAKDFDAGAGRMAPLRYGPAETEVLDGKAAHDARTRMGVTGLGQFYGFRADGMAEEPRPWAFAGGGMGGMGGMGGFGAAPTDLALSEDLFGRPPFAPASAIELVVLPRRDSVQLTIYNSADLTLVRERRNLTLKRGWNWLQFMWANTLIDPTSLHLEPLDHAGEIEVQQLVYPARLREIGRWLIRSQYEGQAPFEITYFTSGLTWRAFYMGTLSADETKMALEGYVRVDNASGEDYEQAQTRLIVGQVHLLDEIAALARRQRPHGPDPVVADAEGAAWGEWGVTNLNGDGGNGLSMKGVLAFGDAFFGTGKPKEIRKEGLSEYFLYTIEGTETIANQWGKRLGSFSAEDVNV